MTITELRTKLLDKEKQAEESKRKYEKQLTSLRSESSINRVMHDSADLAPLREQVLAQLKLGKQAPGYKAAAKALDRFIHQLRGEGDG